MSIINDKGHQMSNPNTNPLVAELNATVARVKIIHENSTDEITSILAKDALANLAPFAAHIEGIIEKGAEPSK
jgi:hypothetical protein